MNRPSSTDMKLYVSNKSSLIRTICRTQQWSGIRESDINEWLSKNFKSDEGKYLAIKILLNGQFYSESNIIELLKFGIFEKILSKEIKDTLITTENIYILPRLVEAQIDKEVKKTMFIPLLDSDNPSESGNSMIRYITNQLSIPRENTGFHFGLDEKKVQSFERIIFLDDCIGSGKQLDKFWNITLKKTSFCKLLEEKKVYYLSLVGYEKNILDLQIDGRLNGLRVVLCDKLDEKNRIFNGENNIWNCQDELLFANEFFDQLERTSGIRKKGYDDLDFALFMHNSVPDWTLPIFWADHSQWKPLFKRKNSSNDN